MDITDILKLSPEALADTQFKELKKHVIGVMKEVTEAIQNEKWDQVEGMTFSSPAGDGYGIDSNCISFDIGTSEDDIMVVVNRLKELQTLAKKKK